jgi:hypothetical protein
MALEDGTERGKGELKRPVTGATRLVSVFPLHAFYLASEPAGIAPTITERGRRAREDPRAAPRRLPPNVGAVRYELAKYGTFASEVALAR